MFAMMFTRLRAAVMGATFGNSWTSVNWRGEVMMPTNAVEAGFGETAQF